MLLTHHTDTRTYTFLIEVANNDDFVMGAAVCHEVNGETGEIINEYDPKVGRRMVEQRLANSPILLDSYAIFMTFGRAIRAGHKVTLRTLVKEAAITHVRLNGLDYDDDAFETAINDTIVEQEAEAWEEYEGELTDDEWLEEAMTLGLLRDPYDFYNDSKSY